MSPTYVYPSHLINKVTLMQYMTYRVACYLRYDGPVDRERRDFKGSPLGFLEMFDMVVSELYGSPKMVAGSGRIKYNLFLQSSFTFSDSRFVPLYDKRIARSQLCVGNAVSQAKLMFRTRKRETT